jgi:hypothetical protein
MRRIRSSSRPPATRPNRRSAAARNSKASQQQPRTWSGYVRCAKIGRPCFCRIAKIGPLVSTELQIADASIYCGVSKISHCPIRNLERATGLEPIDPEAAIRKEEAEARLPYPRRANSSYYPAPIRTIGIRSHYTAVGKTLAVRGPGHSEKLRSVILECWDYFCSA